MRIICGVDFSPSSSAGMRAARKLARALGDVLTLVHAVPVSHAEEVLAGWNGTTFDRGLAERARRIDATIRNAARERLRSIADGAEAHIIDGPAATALVEAASGADVRLLVVGTHGRSAPVRWALGSVAERVVRNAPCPVLVAHEGTDSAMTCIAVAYDRDEHGRAALDWARSLASGLGAGLAVVHAYWPPSEARRLGMKTLAAEGDPEFERDLVGAIRAEAGLPDSVDVRVVAAWGTAESAVVETAKRAHADMLVVGTSKPDVITRLREGSFALGALRRSTMPVVVFHDGGRAASADELSLG